VHRLRWRAWSGDPLLSPTAIRQAGDGKLDSSLRSVYWRVRRPGRAILLQLTRPQMYLGQLPVPHSSTAPFSGWQIALEHSRAEWASLRTTYLRSPDGVWVNDAPQGKAATHAERSSPIREANGALTKASDATASNPLGLETSNPWRQWFADLELRKALWQDVERTMPEVDYFRDHRIQLAMVNLLHVWTRLNSGIGYRQGMHELLAYLIWVLDSESCPSTSSPRSPLSDLDNSEAIMHLVLSATYLEHDVWSLFSNMMKAASSWYDSTPSIPMPSARATVSGLGNLNDRVTLLQPIVGQSIRIFDVLLRRMDPELFGKLESLSIEPQMWGIRWMWVSPPSTPCISSHRPFQTPDVRTRVSAGSRLDPLGRHLCRRSGLATGRLHLRRHASASPQQTCATPAVTGHAR
jgi:TBC1 domain family protein 5